MRLGFTGTREGMTKHQKKAFLEFIKSYNEPTYEFHHGDCIGSDLQAAKIVRETWGTGCKIIAHPPLNSKHSANNMFSDIRLKEKNYLARNHDIVDMSTWLVATPFEGIERLRSGTWATIRYAQKIGKTVFVITPEGEIQCWKKE